MRQTHLRNALASLCSLGVIFGMMESVGRDWWLLALVYALLVVAAVAVHRAALAPQLLARAVWWATLALGTLLCIVGSGREVRGGIVISLGCGTALLVSGRKAFDAVASTTRNVPPALRSMLMLLMIFALADAQTFLTFASVAVLDDDRSVVAMPAVFGLIGFAYVGGFVGLYRLQIWGAIVNIVTSLAAIAVLLMSEIVDKSDLRTFLVLLATVHVATAAPVTLAALRGKSLPALPAAARQIVTTVVIGALMLVSLVMFGLNARF